MLWCFVGAGSVGSVGFWGGGLLVERGEEVGQDPACGFTENGDMGICVCQYMYICMQMGKYVCANICKWVYICMCAYMYICM